MNAIVLLTLTVLAVVGPASAHFGLPFDNDCTAGKLLDPFLMQALKSKYPKKFCSKLDLAKDLAMDAKCRLQATKLLARHMKNLNAANYDLQTLMCQAQQPGLLQPMIYPDQSGLMAQQQLQQQQQQQQQQQIYQIPIDLSKVTITQQDPQSCYPQLTDPRYQQLQRYGSPTIGRGCPLTSLRPQQNLYQAGLQL